MIRPIVAFGDPILKQMAAEVEEGDATFDKLVEDLFETMYDANGVGLAAPQVGVSQRVFVVDASPFAEDEDGDPKLKGFKKVFVNPVILEENGDQWSFAEGCLSIPTIREEVRRLPVIRIKYQDENFKEHEGTFDGFAARIIQHEYDHLEGVLFTDRLDPLKKRLLKGKLKSISKGDVEVSYRMKFPVRK